MDLLEKISKVSYKKTLESIESIDAEILEIEARIAERQKMITLRDDLTIKYEEALIDMPEEEAAAEHATQSDAPENESRREFLKKAAKVGVGLAAGGALLGVGEFLKDKPKKKGKKHAENTIEPTKPTHIDTVRVENTKIDSTKVDSATEKPVTGSTNPEKTLYQGVELPTDYGKIGERMDMKFYNERLKDLSDKLAYLEWVNETTHQNEGPNYLFMVSKNRTELSIVDRNGHPVMTGIKIICGEKRGDGTGPGHTPAGYIQSSWPVNPDILETHNDRALHLDVPNISGGDLKMFAHDTINYVRPFDVGESDTEQKANQQKSKRQRESLTSKNPNDRRLSLECLRIPGLESGKYDKFLKPATTYQKIDNERVEFKTYPAFAISPEETKEGMIKIIDRYGRGNLTKYVTPKEYQAMLQAIIDRNNIAKRETK